MIKKIFQGIFIAIVILSSCAGSLASAQIQPHLVNKTNTWDANSFTASYEFYGKYAEPKTIYAWVGEYVSPTDYSLWDKRRNLITITGTPDPVSFSAKFDFNTLGPTTGKVFGYLLADRSVPGNSPFITQSGSPTVRCLNVTQGDVPCTPPVSSSGGAGGAGGAGGGIGSGTMQTGTATIGQVNVAFPSAQQVITANAAELHGTVTTTLAMPVDLSIAMAPSSSAVFSNEQRAFTGQVQPNQPATFAVTYSGLATGQTYQFVIKNNVTGQTSAPLQFTTTGGAGQPGAITYPGALFPYTPTNPDASGSSVAPTQYPDTISDRGIVPHCGRTQNAAGTIPPKELEMCTYKDFMQLIANVIQYGIILLGVIVAAMVMYAGFMIIVLSWNGDPTAEITRKRKEYGAMLIKIFVGVLIILLAWTIVATILRELGVDASYILLDIVSPS